MQGPYKQKSLSGNFSHSQVILPSRSSFYLSFMWGQHSNLSTVLLKLQSAYESPGDFAEMRIQI